MGSEKGEKSMRSRPAIACVTARERPIRRYISLRNRSDSFSAGLEGSQKTNTKTEQKTHLTMQVYDRKGGGASSCATLKIRVSHSSFISYKAKRQVPLTRSITSAFATPDYCGDAEDLLEMGT